MTRSRTVAPLDNPIWHALTGPHARFAEGTGLALRYDPGVSPFAALPDGAPGAAWQALGHLIGEHGAAVLFPVTPVPPPSGWEITMALPTLQMVAEQPIGDPDAAFVGLGDPDVPEMMALVERTRPGPFLARTHELGAYLGLREEGALVAMAGERMHLPGYTEISAVCTDPAARKRGLASRLVRAVAAGIEARGETAMLHVLADNHGAIRVYESLGFTARASFDVIIVRSRR
jgi:ribosomal protein S18 acetylase RimI-like enzyme